MPNNENVNENEFDINLEQDCPDECAECVCSCEGEQEEIEATDKEKGKKDKTSKNKHLSKEEKKLKEELDKTKKLYDELSDRYLRVVAEYDNYRKRTAKEKESIYTDANVDVLETILPVLDNLERAEQFAESEKVAEGIRMITKQFCDSLSKLNVEEIQALNAPFDPNIHNAVMHIEDDTLGENIVVEVLQKGYIKGERVIRPAIVKVAN